MAYIGQEPGQGTAQRSIFTAVAVTDTVTADDDGLPINYTVGQVSVYLNGVKQVVGDDVVASNGSTLVFASDYAIGDVIEVIALDTFSVGTVEGTALISTGESGGTKFLREDGDGTSSWQTITADTSHIQQTSINLTGTITDSYFLSLAYVLTGDVDLVGTNVFGKVADGTTNVSITNDGSTRTLSGEEGVDTTLLLNSVMFN